MVPVEHTSPIGSASPTRVKPPLPSGTAVPALVVQVLVAEGVQRPPWTPVVPGMRLSVADRPLVCPEMRLMAPGVEGPNCDV
jgi:hypothetical protein